MNYLGMVLPHDDTVNDRSKKGILFYSGIKILVCLNGINTLISCYTELDVLSTCKDEAWVKIFSIVKHPSFIVQSVNNTKNVG